MLRKEISTACEAMGSARQSPLRANVGVIAMDWIEKLIGWNPDGGDGSAETAIVLVAVILLAAVIVWQIPSLRRQLKALFVAWKPK